MTIEEAIKHAEEKADSHDRMKQIKAVTLEECKCAEEYRQLAEWLKELKQLREQTRWIPVSERFPEIGQHVLCSLIKAKGVKHRVIICEYKQEVWWSYVQAWMPLPQPYKGESEDKCKNCKYYRNPDYTRCHECETEREDKE